MNLWLNSSAEKHLTSNFVLIFFTIYRECKDQYKNKQGYLGSDSKTLCLQYIKKMKTNIKINRVTYSGSACKNSVFIENVKFYIKINRVTFYGSDCKTLCLQYIENVKINIKTMCVIENVKINIKIYIVTVKLYKRSQSLETKN